MVHSVVVDQGKCIGCGACVATCPGSFRMDSGKSYVVKAKVEELTCEKAAETGCPVGAISVD